VEYLAEHVDPIIQRAQTRAEEEEKNKNKNSSAVTFLFYMDSLAKVDHQSKVAAFRIQHEVCVRIL